MRSSRFSGESWAFRVGKQICFFEKNFLDLDNESATVSATQGNDFAKYVRSRSLRSAWLTTGSVDADNTEFEIDLANSFNIDRMILVDHNFKSYKIEQYDFDSGLWTSIFDTTNDVNTTSEIVLSEFYGQRFKITIRGTKVADSDKRLNRVLITKKLGQFRYWPKIDNPVVDQGRSVRKTLSGKSSVLRTVGAFRCSLKISNWKNADDLALIEALYRQVQGFEVWFSAGDETQFYYTAEGYRSRDIYLMGFSNDWSPSFKNGIYSAGMEVDLNLIEVVT